jgi:hypothetical protein
VGTVLFGASIAEKAGLREKLVTNQERFSEINRVLAAESVPPADRLRNIAVQVETAERYRFVSESGFKIEKLLSSVRLAAKALLSCDEAVDARAKLQLERIASAERSDEYQTLNAVQELIGIIPQIPRSTPLDMPRAITFRLIQLVWQGSFRYYFSLKKKHEPCPKPRSSDSS